MRVLLALMLAGCGESDDDAADLAVAADLAPAPVTLAGPDGGTPMSAFYSFWIEPLEHGAQTDVYLVLTLIDARWHCGDPAQSFDALGFGFAARIPGVTSSNVLQRHGPRLGPSTGGDGWAELDGEDDRLQGWDFDGGTVQVTSGGSVSGQVHFAVAGLTLDGSFTAPHCAALDFVAAP